MRSDHHSRPASVLWSILRWNLSLGLGLWILGCAAFLVFTLRMDNDFATYAREHHQLTALLANLKTLPAYGLLALGYTLLGFPLLLPRWAGGTRAAWARLARHGLQLLGVNLILFLSSISAAALVNTSFLDALSRAVSKVWSGVNLYWLADWHLLEGLALLGALIVLRAIWVWRRVVARPDGRGPGSWLLDSALLAGVILLAFWQLRPQQAPAAFNDPGRPNVIILASDSLRADHLSCYGYERLTSPHMDALAHEGVRFENFFVSTASTLESWITLLTSEFPATHGIRYMFPSKERVARVASNQDSLPRILARQGYHTAVSSNWAGNCFRLVDMGFAANRASDVQNFDVFIAEAALMAHLVFPIYFNNRLGEWLYPEVRQITSYLNPDALIGRFVDELDLAQRRQQPFFGVLFTSHTHLPYAAAWPFNVKWTDPAYRGPNRYEIDFEVDQFIQHGFREDLTPDQVQHIKDLYDGCVSDFDDTVGRVTKILKRRGLLDQTLIIVTSDHGDDLYDPGVTLGHGTNFFGGDQTTRIPVIMRFPGQAHAGVQVQQIVRSVDFAPTLLDVLKLPRPESFQGVSLLPTLARPEPPLDLAAFGETCYLFYRKKGLSGDELTVAPADSTLYIDPQFDDNFVLKEQYHQPVLDTKDRMMRTTRWKLIWIPGRSGPILRFYDMLADPHEEHDLSGQNLPVMARMFAALKDWWRDQGAPIRWPREADAPDR